MLIGYKRGQTSVILRVKILNSSLGTGAGLTGLTSGSSGLRISTIVDNEATATAYTVAGSTIETITTLGTYATPTSTKCRFKEVDATNHPGVYELQIADARFAVSNAKSLMVSISGATNAAETDVVIPLTDIDFYSATVDSNVTNIAGAAVNTSSAQLGVNVVNAGGTAWGSGAITAASIANDAITAAKVANGAIDAATFAADVDAEILSYLVDDATRIDASSLNTATGTTIPAMSTLLTGLQTTIGIPNGVDLVADIAAIHNEIGADGLGLTAIPWNTAWDAEVQSECADALTAYGASTTSDVATVAGYLDTEIAAILADTNELQTDWANGGRLDLILDARASQSAVDDLPTNAELATALASGVNLTSIAGAPVAVDTGTAGTISFVSGEYVATNGGTFQANVVQVDGENVQHDGNGYLRVDVRQYYDPDSASYQAFPVRFSTTQITTDGDVTAAGYRDTGGAFATFITAFAGISTVTDRLDDTLEDNAGTYRFTSASLAQAPTGGSAPTAEEIADEVETRTIAAVTTLVDPPPDSAGVTTLLTRIPAALFTGITSLAQWLGLLAGKQVGDSTARTEIRATGAGSGTYNETTDSQEALRDRGDSAWTTATGFSTHSASDVWAVSERLLSAGTNIVLAKGTGITGFNDLSDSGVRDAVGLTSPNLDTQLSSKQATFTAATGVTFPSNFGALGIDASGHVSRVVLVDTTSALTGYTSPPSAATISTTVWAETTRRLSDGTNIVLAKGTGITGFNDLDAAGVRTALGLTSANLDTQLDNIPTVSELNARTLPAANYATDTDLDAVLADTNELQTDWADGGRLDLILDARASQSSVNALPTAAAIVAELKNWAVFSGYSWETFQKELSAALVGNVTGSGSVYRAPVTNVSVFSAAVDVNDNRTITR